MMIRVVMFSAIFFLSGERASGGNGNRERWWAISHWTRCQFMLGMDTEP
jgi:hypothetical protein